LTSGVEPPTTVFDLLCAFQPRPRKTPPVKFTAGEHSALIAIIPEPPPTESVERSANSATGQTVDIKISGVSTVGEAVVVVAAVVVVVEAVVVVVGLAVVVVVGLAEVVVVVVGLAGVVVEVVGPAEVVVEVVGPAEVVVEVVGLFAVVVVVEPVAVVVVVDVVVVVCGGVHVWGAATMLAVKLTGTEMSPIPVEGIQSVYFGQVTARALQAKFASSGVGLDETVVVDTGVVVSNPMHTTRNMDHVPLPSVALT